MQRTEASSTEMMCEVCEAELAVGVSCVPFVPVSAAYGKKCLKANAHPWWAMVANTALIGGREMAVPEWKRMVKCTCRRLGKTLEIFDAEVKNAIIELNRPPAVRVGRPEGDA